MRKEERERKGRDRRGQEEKQDRREERSGAHVPPTVDPCGITGLEQNSWQAADHRLHILEIH